MKPINISDVYAHNAIVQDAQCIGLNVSYEFEDGLCVVTVKDLDSGWYFSYDRDNGANSLRPFLDAIKDKWIREHTLCCECKDKFK